MKLSQSIKPISYLKTHAADIVRNLGKNGGDTLIITQNGEAKVVIQDIGSWEKTQEAIAMLKILTLADRDIEAGRVIPATEALARVRAKSRKLRGR